MNRRNFLMSAAAVIVVAGAGVAVAVPDIFSAEAAGEPTAATATEATAPVRRGDLSTEREFRAAVSFGDTWAITTTATGTLTAQHLVGAIVDFGEVLVRIDNEPLFLGHGVMPMYRELHEVDTRGRDQNGDRRRLMSGLDVAQLQVFLLDAAFDADATLEADGIFGPETELAVEAWQESVGLNVTGRVDQGQLVFESAPVRIASESRVGGIFNTLEVNNAEPVVLVETSNRDRVALPTGIQVEVVLPDDSSLAGTVTDQEQVTGVDGSPVWRTTVAADGDLPGDASAAVVVVTELLAEDVLLVPVGALLALAEGGFAVEVPIGAETKLVSVEVGEVLDGRAEITGDLAEGAEVVVAG